MNTDTADKLTDSTLLDNSVGSRVAEKMVKNRTAKVVVKTRDLNASKFENSMTQ